MQVSPGPAPVVRGLVIPGPFGHTTQRFFLEGARHEASGWTDTVLPPDDEPEERVRSGSFDRVPRQTGAMIVVGCFAFLLLAGVGYGAHALWRDAHALAESITRYFKPGAVAAPPVVAPPVPAVEPASLVEAPWSRLAPEPVLASEPEASALATSVAAPASADPRPAAGPPARSVPRARAGPRPVESATPVAAPAQVAAVPAVEPESPAEPFVLDPPPALPAASVGEGGEPDPFQPAAAAPPSD